MVYLNTSVHTPPSRHLACNSSESLALQLNLACASGQLELKFSSISILLRPIMPNHHRPGQNIRQLARQRRAEAVRLFFAAVAVGAYLDIITFYFTVLPIYVYALCASSIVAFILIANGVWRQANRADQGAKAEETIGHDLNSLQRSGWHIEYGRRLPLVGDVDIICRSPQGQVFAIDVKSHRGTVIHNRGQLHRQVGNSQYPFEKDFLGQVKR